MNIFLFHRDLRIQDNTSLINLIKEKGSIIPIFIFPPEQIDEDKNKYFSHNTVQFMIESLHELSDNIKDNKGKLYFFKGDTLEVLKNIHKKIGIESISYNIDYTPYSRKRDKDIREWCNKEEVECIEKEDYLLYDILDGQTKKADGNPYLVFTPFRNHCYANLKVNQINKFNKFTFQKEKELEKIKYNISEDELDDFYIENPKINVNGGRKLGLAILKNIKKFKDYSKDRDTLTYKTTFLGAYLKFGTISIREAYFSIGKSLGFKSGLINELHWRDFYANIIYEFPRVLQGQLKGDNKSFKEDYDKVKWSYDKKIFEKWCEGETGYPVIDAAMKQLNETGYMHNRCRMIVASFLTKDLHIDWRWGEKYFATKLIDYDPMSNSGGWQWATGNGTDAQPYFRIFNPWTQTEKFDADCDYIKQWLPELKNVQNKDILNWFKPDIYEKYLKLGIKYFKPIVEHDEERKKTLELYKKALK